MADRRKTAARSLALAAAVALAVGVTASGSAQRTANTPTARAAAAPAPDNFSRNDWPIFGRDRDNTRFAPQTQINARSISRLGEAWSSDLGGDQYLTESFPTIVGGTLYVTTSTDEVYAFDGATGKVKWKYAPDVDFSLSTGVGGYGVTVNRGVVVSNGHVYLLTFDDHLESISAATGEEEWSSSVADAHTGAYETMSPQVWDGKVFVGDSGSESGVRGFVAAYNARTGKQLWRFWTVPKPGTGWVKPGNGGGTVYMAPTIDTKTGILYAGTGNPSPTIAGADRPGKNLYTSSIIAVNAQTGKLVWYHQEIPHDLYDYDAASPTVLATVPIDGKQRRVVMEAGKSGYFFMFDAKTGATVHPRVAFVKEDHKPPTTKGVVECPGPLGGSQYSPIAYSPRTHAAYISGINFCFTLVVSSKKVNGETKFGGYRSFPTDVKGTGTFDAVDLTTGKFLWKRNMSTPMAAGATATASDLVFTGDQNGVLYAMDAKTGKTVWHAHLGLAVSTAPVIYTVKGTEYVAISIGGSALTSAKSFGPIGSGLIVLKIGGKKIVPLKPRKSTN